MLGLLGEQASDFAHKVDYAHDVVTIISVLCTVAICGAMLYFAVRYRQKDGKDHETPMIEGNSTLEVIWTVFPTIVVIWVAYLGYDAYVDIRTVPENAMEVNVVGRKWAWDFEYKNGKKTTGELVVPVDEPIKLIMTSKDVLHSLFVPVMRAKMDVIPGRYTYQWFRPIKTGDFQVFCTEYCGTEHSRMLARLKVLPKAEFERWVSDDTEQRKLAAMKPSDRGKEIYAKQCITCHSLDGSRKIGPSWLRLFQNKDKKLADGSTIQVDENYVKESIVNPNAKLVEGFSGGMSSFQGILSDDDIHGVIEFIKTLDGTQKVEVAPVAPPPSEGPDAAALAAMSPSERGKLVFNDAGNACMTCHTIDGAAGVGPTMKGLFGKKEKLADGSEVTVDEAYIKESILKPQAKLVQGFQPVMPAMYEGKLSDEQIKDITEYIKSLQ